MKIIGITGSVASGKNILAEILAKNGGVIFDADQVTHQLLEKDTEVINQVKAIFPESFQDSKINRRELSRLIFKSDNFDQSLKKLEAIVHPKVRSLYDKFLQENSNASFLILNIPLLLETSNYRYDKLIAITVSDEIKRRRFIKRALDKDPSLVVRNLEEKFSLIIKKQISDEQRIAAADFVIDNNHTKEKLRERALEILDEIKNS